MEINYIKQNSSRQFEGLVDIESSQKLESRQKRDTEVKIKGGKGRVYVTDLAGTNKA
jgi:hypothetical protein